MKHVECMKEMKVHHFNSLLQEIVQYCRTYEARNDCKQENNTNLVNMDEIYDRI